VADAMPRLLATVTLTLALAGITAGVGTAGDNLSLAARLHPVSCFRAHGWTVTGTNTRGTARKPQHGVPRRYWSYVKWWGPPPYTVSDFVSRRQKRLVKTCTGRDG
jgi:hypothetical protein